MTDCEKVVGNLQILRTWCAVNPRHGMGLNAGDCEKAVGWLDDALALLKAYKRRQALEVHNISNVDIPDGVTEAQFHAVMYNVVEALEHTDRGESWPYDEEGGEKNVAE